ncbi:hypothetical protein [Nocardia terpenica]|uniref:Uncharacterized protein n=1 Tax=Nocardia terpenica TaxID=455432 RepID=A0A6G9Z0I3_9NOCA|nr:hypothetical protein [Nocardia terpenica]QIS18877.1 hypothetical protein F6W96_11795 [Nocardia terpenica]
MEMSAARRGAVLGWCWAATLVYLPVAAMFGQWREPGLPLLAAFTAAGALAWSAGAAPLHRAGCVLIACAAGAAAVAVLLPAELDPELHIAAPAMRWAAQLLGMTFIAIAFPQRVIRLWTAVCAVATAVGGWLLYGPAAGPSAIGERIALDTSTVWTGVIGLLVLGHTRYGTAAWRWSEITPPRIRRASPVRSA